MSGSIKVSEDRWWMVAGWVFDGVMKSALEHIPDSEASLRRVVEDSIAGLNCIMLGKECTSEEVRVLFDALRMGYKETQSAGPSAFGDPSYFSSYLERYAELIRMIEEELESKDQGDCGGPAANARQ